MQKPWQLRVGRQPIDFVSVAGSVRVQQGLIKNNNHIRLDFGVDCKAVLAAAGNKLYRLWLQ